MNQENNVIWIVRDVSSSNPVEIHGVYLTYDDAAKVQPLLFYKTEIKKATFAIVGDDYTPGVKISEEHLKALRDRTQIIIKDEIDANAKIHDSLNLHNLRYWEHDKRIKELESRFQSDCKDIEALEMDAKTQVMINNDLDERIKILEIGIVAQTTINEGLAEKCRLLKAENEIIVFDFNKDRDKTYDKIEEMEAELDERIKILETCNSGCDLMHNGANKRFEEVEQRTTACIETLKEFDAALIENSFKRLWKADEEKLKRIATLEEELAICHPWIRAPGLNILEMEERIKKLEENIELFDEVLDKHTHAGFSELFGELRERIAKLEEDNSELDAI